MQVIAAKQSSSQACRWFTFTTKSSRPSFHYASLNHGLVLGTMSSRSAEYTSPSTQYKYTRSHSPELVLPHCLVCETSLYMFYAEVFILFAGLSFKKTALILCWCWSWCCDWCLQIGCLHSRSDSTCNFGDPTFSSSPPTECAGGLGRVEGR